MARSEADREDLLREATALAERAELLLADYAEPIVIGFRRDGSSSVFIGVEPVYQFNTQCELRRAYVAGRLIKAEEGRLIALTRERTTRAVNLIRHPLSDGETAELLAACRGWLMRIATAIAASEYRCVGQAPPEAAVVPRIAAWLAAFPAAISPARRPNVG